MKKINIYIFDFDGTIIRTNSFRKWTIKFFLKYNKNVSLYKNVKLTLLFIYFYTLRYLKLITHKELKYRFLSLWNKNYKSDKILFEFLKELIDKDKRLNIYNDFLKLLDSNELIIVSTAAPDLYIKYLKELFPKITEIHSTKYTNNISDFVENKGKKKRENFFKFLKNLKLHKDNVNITFYTDNDDDAPLMEIADKVIKIK